MKTQKEFIEQACKLLAHNPEAIDFIKAHNDFVHIVDDVVDEEMIPLDKAEAFRAAWSYYHHPYYLKHIGNLSMLALINHIFYQTSVLWEKDTDPVKVTAAGTLRHNSIGMLFAVIAIECGAATANRVAADFFEHTLLAHKDDKEFNITNLQKYGTTEPS